MTRGIFLCLALITLCSCGTYRKTSLGYRGIGDYKPPGGGSAGRVDTPSADDIKTRNLPYAPRSAFQVAWPVRNIRVNRGFRPASDRKHEGVDLGGKRESPILSAHEGVVIYTGSDFRGYGNMVLVEYSNEWATLYGHLDSVIVRAGQIVESGDPLGGMGDSGLASGVHLHFELLHNRKPIDPLPYLPRVNRFARAR